MYKRIVAGVSKTDTARAVAEKTVELANLFGADVELVCCFEPSGADGLPVRRHAETFVNGVAQRVRGTATSHVLPDDPAEAILEVAQRSGADLIIVGNKGVQGARRVLGSVAKTVTQRADCAVLILATT